MILKLGYPMLAETHVHREDLRKILTRWVLGLGYQPKSTLLIPPDFTRCHSWAGPITTILYKLLSSIGRVDIMPALGTHETMSDEERLRMFGPGIPAECFISHDWRRDIRSLGEIPGTVIHELSDGKLDYSVQIEINRRVMDGDYDLIVSIGQVVPHEVAGMANGNKNILIGCGGKDMIDKSHFLGAVCGIEQTLGRTDTPVRRLFDIAKQGFLHNLPLHYIQTVTSVIPDERVLPGLFIGEGREPFAAAAQMSQQVNLTLLEQPVQKVLVYLEPDHFRSTWLGNKAIYRTRMAIADGGELVIIAPGIRHFGEDPEIDRLIRTYGYHGTPRILELLNEKAELRANLSAAAHLIHGSTEGRFRVTYASGGISREEIEAVGFGFQSLEESIRRYHPASLKQGNNTMADGETIYFIPNPALGLWALNEHFAAADGG